MRLRAFLICVISVFICVIRGYSEEESITITTYYPSPYGSYNELRTNRMAVGYLERSDACWDPEGGVCPGTGTNIIDDPYATPPRNIDLIVNGTVGIGTTDPKAAKLRVADNGTATGDARATVNVYNTLTTGSTSGRFSFDNAQNKNYWELATDRGINGGNNFYIWGNNTEQLYIDGNTNSVGIGTTAPAGGNRLHVYTPALQESNILIDSGGSSARLRIGRKQAQSGEMAVAYLTNDTEVAKIGMVPWQSDLKFVAGSGNLTNAQMVINATNGRVGIGTEIPSSGLKLDVEGKIGATGYCDENGDNCVSLACPPGFNDTGYGYCIQTDEDPALSWFSASKYCADTYNARLCSSSEWYNACVNDKANNMDDADLEMTEDWILVSPANTFEAIERGGGSCEGFDRHTLSSPQIFRCCRSK